MTPADEDTVHCVRLEPGGTQFHAKPSQTLLQAALQAGVPLRSSCRNGTCRTCLVQLLEGRIRYAIEWPGLSADEKREGCLLPCVAHPLSDVVLGTG